MYDLDLPDDLLNIVASYDTGYNYIRNRYNSEVKRTSTELKRMFGSEVSQKYIQTGNSTMGLLCSYNRALKVFEEYYQQKMAGAQEDYMFEILTWNFPHPSQLDDLLIDARISAGDVSVVAEIETLPSYINLMNISKEMFSALYDKFRENPLIRHYALGLGDMDIYETILSTLPDDNYIMDIYHTRVIDLPRMLEIIKKKGHVDVSSLFSEFHPPTKIGRILIKSFDQNLYAVSGASKFIEEVIDAKRLQRYPTVYLMDIPSPELAHKLVSLDARIQFNDDIRIEDDDLIYQILGNNLIDEDSGGQESGEDRDNI